MRALLLFVLAVAARDWRLATGRHVKETKSSARTSGLSCINRNPFKALDASVQAGLVELILTVSEARCRC
jgi:hypothetical protein